jgi:hypothetical protein
VNRGTAVASPLGGGTAQLRCDGGLTPFLALDAQGGRGEDLQPTWRDRVPTVRAEAVRAFPNSVPGQHDGPAPLRETLPKQFPLLFDDFRGRSVEPAGAASVGGIGHTDGLLSKPPQGGASPRHFPLLTSQDLLWNASGGLHGVLRRVESTALV